MMQAHSRSLSAQWFDGKTARRTPVTLTIGADLEVVVQAQADPADSDSDADLQSPLCRAALADIKVSERVGDTPYRLQFPDGALAVTADHAAVEAAFALDPGAHWLARMERARWAVVAATVGLAAALLFAWQSAVPEVAAFVAERIPRESEDALGRVALEGLDRWLLKPTKFDVEALAPTIRVFRRLAAEAGLTDVVDLEFRDTVPNALALPGGTIVVTDGLVKLFGSDERLLAAVLAHEMGHVHYRHSLRHLISASASAMIVGVLTGDVSGISSLTANAPIILSALDYTRDAEREADRYAFDLLRKAGYSPKDFADAMRRFDAMELCFALRSKQRERDKAKAWKEGDSTDDDQIDSDDTAKAGDHSTASKPLCTVDPEGYVNAHRGEVEGLEWEDRETGYLHTHPVTRERITAAEAAAAQPGR